MDKLCWKRFFIFSLAFLLHLNTTFRNFTRGYFTSIYTYNRSLSQMKGKMNLPCKVTSRRKFLIPLQTKPTPLNFISMGFRIFCNSQNLKEITSKVYHFYKSTSSPSFRNPCMYIMITQKSKVLYYLFCFGQLLIKKHTILSFLYWGVTWCLLTVL